MQSLLQKKAKLTEENPFYRMSALLEMLTQLPKASDSITKNQVYQYLRQAWSECNTKDKREAFFVVLFSIGDIQNREHNVFKKIGIKDVDGGGHSKRKVFAYCLEWMLTTIPEQFYRFMPIYGEYYSLDVFRMYHLITDRKTGTLKEVIKLPVDVARVTDFIAKTLKNVRTTDNERSLWARWLPHVPSTKRIRKYTINEKNIKAFQKNGHNVKLGDVVTVKKDKKTETNKKDVWVTEFIKVLSEKMNWQVVKHAKNMEFRGYKKFRTQFLETSEAAMFSSKRIMELDEQQLLEWFDKLPSGARFRVACRLVYKDEKGNYVSKGNWKNKFGVDIATVYVKWMQSKEVAQQKLRELSPEQKQALAPTELRQMEKAAKVNTGADSILDVIVDALTSKNSQELDIKAHSILDKIKIEVPVRLLVDTSGSMTSASVTHKGTMFTAADMAKIATTLMLLKSPEEELSDMFIRFDSKAEVICAGERVEAQTGPNRFMSSSAKVVDVLTDRSKPFSWNLANVSQYVISRGATYLTSVAAELKKWVSASGPAFVSQRIEAINKYPVWLIISDGDINNAGNGKESIMQFQNDMRQYFGWDGVVILWDIKEESSLYKGRFEGLNNFMHFAGCNPSIVNQIFKNIHDLDIVDTFMPLKAIHASNRYAPVKELVD